MERSLLSKIVISYPPSHECVYLSARLFYVSEIQRLLEESNAIPVGVLSELAVGGLAALDDMNPDWPMTSEAVSPLVNGVVYFSARLFDVSDTQRLPEESNAIPVCPLSELAVG